MTTSLTRRDMLKTTAALALVGSVPRKLFAQTPAATSKRVLRLAHFTDSHVQPELRAGEGLTACFRHAFTQPDPPQFALFGGDHIMSAYGETADRTRLQWDLFARILKDECPVPVQSCIGNHDIWGWDKSKSGTTGAEPNYGKKWTIESRHLPGRFYAFDRAGWRFLVLDSVQPDGPLFRGEIDPEQFDWLKEQLSRTPHDMPVLILSHMPIISTTGFMALRTAEESGKEWRVPAIAMHIDARKLVALFDEHPNVKLCLSGHTHLLDRVDYNSVTYICGGSICGAKWRGPTQRCKEGYGLINLYANGRFEHQYVTYGWQAT